MQKLNITYNGDNFGISDALVFNNIVNDEYTNPIEDLSIKHDEFNDFIKSIELYNFTIYDFTSGKRVLKYYKSDKAMLIVSGTHSKTLFLDIYTKTLEDSEKIFKQYNKYSTDDESDGIFITNYFIENGSVQNSVERLEKSDYKANKLYYPYIKTDSMFNQFFGNQENILLLCGKPGTGKSKMVSLMFNYMIDNVEFLPNSKDKDEDLLIPDIAYVKNIEVLANDSWWKQISNRNYDLVVLDDLDFFLTSRNKEVQTHEDELKNKFLSQFLSFTDGIIKNNTKFVITTNQEYNDIDNALLRKGRLFDILELRTLNNDEAQNIWKDNNLDMDFPFTENQILQADLGSMIEKYNNKYVEIEKYLLEDNISKINNASKKVGF